MHAMPIDVARQLVADRHASYEGAAQRRRLRRFLTRRPAYDAPLTTAAVQTAPPAVVARREGAPTATASRRVA